MGQSLTQKDNKNKIEHWNYTLLSVLHEQNLNGKADVLVIKENNLYKTSKDTVLKHYTIKSEVQDTIEKNLSMLPEFINLFKDEIENNKKYEYIKEYYNTRWLPLVNNQNWEDLDDITKEASIYNNLFTTSETGDDRAELLNGLIQYYYELDKDGNGSISEEEAKIFLPNNLDKQKKDNIIKIINGTDGDNSLSMFEYFDLCFYLAYDGVLSQRNVYIYAKFYEYILEQTNAKPPDINTTTNTTTADINTMSGKELSNVSGKELSNVIIRF